MEPAVVVLDCDIGRYTVSLLLKLRYGRCCGEKKRNYYTYVRHRFVKKQEGHPSHNRAQRSEIVRVVTVVPKF